MFKLWDLCAIDGVSQVWFIYHMIKFVNGNIYSWRKSCIFSYMSQPRKVGVIYWTSFVDLEEAVLTKKVTYSEGALGLMNL